MANDNLYNINQRPSQSAGLAALMQLPGAGPLPPTSPIQPATQPQTDPMQALQEESLKSSEFGRQQLASEIARLQGMTNQEGALRGQQAQLAPHLAYHPNFEPVTGGTSLLRDIGRGLLSFGASTGIGRAIDETVHSGQRAQYANLGQQISDIQKQIEGEKEIIPAAASALYHPLMAGASAGRAQAEMLSAQSRAKYDAAMIPLRQQWQQIQQQLGQGKISQEQARTQMEGQIANARNQTLQGIASMYSDQRDRDVQIQAAENEFKTETGSWLQTLLGTGPTPPSKAPTPAGSAKATGSKATIKPTAQAQHVPGGRASGLQEGQTGTGSDGKKYVVKGGVWVPQSQ